MPDVGMAQFQMDRQRRVLLACEKWWPLVGPNTLQNRSDCSGFVISVAGELGILLNGNANAIYYAIQLSPWTRLGVGDFAANLAAAAATNGSFVVGAWRNSAGGNGHVAVIVDTNHSSANVPFRSRAIAYWGTLGAEGKKYERHSLSWGDTKRPQVLYASRGINLM